MTLESLGMQAAFALGVSIGLSIALLTLIGLVAIANHQRGKR